VGGRECYSPRTLLALPATPQVARWQGGPQMVTGPQAASVGIPFTALAAEPGEATIAMFQGCLAQRAPGMPATFKRDGDAYDRLQRFNAQQRTEKLLPLVFVEPGLTG